MQNHILAVVSILKDSKGKFVSGEKISKKLSISRVGVYKIIKKLIVDGYKIERHKKLGYKLVEIPFSPEDLLKKSSFLAKIIFLKSTSSTMDVAKEFIEEEKNYDKVLIIAQQQHSGKGRLERKWFSPKGGIYFSLILKPNVLPYEIFMLNYVFSLSVVETAKELYNIEVFTKWPNDVVSKDNKKLCGILLEVDSEIDKVNYCIVGVGINVNIDGKFFKKHSLFATSFYELTGQKLDLTEFMITLFKYIEKNYKLFEQKKFKQLSEFWISHSSTIGKEVEVQTLTQTIKGKAIDINSQTGALLIKTSFGVKEILSGDCIHLR